MRMLTVALGVMVAACGQNAAPPVENAAVREAAVVNEVEASPMANASDASIPDNVAEPTDARACQLQDGKEIAANRLRATGTEPFWSATIDGRCVTYSTPENQEGARVWTKFTGSRDAGQWSGSLGKDRFVLVTRPDATCSDGMSDRNYPIAVTLTIGSDERRGCAAPRLSELEGGSGVPTSVGSKERG